MEKNFVFATLSDETVLVEVSRGNGVFALLHPLVLKP